MPLLVTDLDFVLLMIIGYGLGVLTGLSFCVKYRNTFLTRSRSLENLNHQANVLAHQEPVIQASAPPATNPKITIQ